jgi:hypothetical protein
MRKWSVLSLVMVGMIVGCTSRLAVKKVAEEGDDRVTGFRYYLSRPYVVVQQPILVSETVRVGTFRPEEREGKDLGPCITDLKKPGVKEVGVADLQAIKQRLQVDAAVKPVAFQETEDSLPDPQLLRAAADGTAAALDTVPSDVGKHLEAPTGDPKGLSDKDRLKGSIKVFFLPDFEECYAVHCKSAIAKSAYKLTFRDGWELTDVAGEFDSTTFAIELLTAIDNAINSAKQVSEAGIDRQKAVADAYAKDAATKRANAANKDRADAQKITHYQEIVRVYIKPGIYRINKPWEIEGGLQAQHGQGLLTSLGLTLQQVTERQVLPADRVGILDKTKAKTDSEKVGQ